MASHRVLIVCTGNSCRSQMAEGLMRHLAQRRQLDLEVHSAGTRPCAVNPRAIESLAEIGIDISRQKAKDVLIFAGQIFDYVITVCNSAAELCPVFPGRSQRLHWPTEDPARAKGSDDLIHQAFVRVRDDLHQRIDRWLTETFPSEPISGN